VSPVPKTATMRSVPGAASRPAAASTPQFSARPSAGKAACVMRALCSAVMSVFLYPNVDVATWDFIIRLGRLSTQHARSSVCARPAET
ncbi:hypothetical protein KIL84_005817, partial [Mauremys mutica]